MAVVVIVNDSIQKCGPIDTSGITQHGLKKPGVKSVIENVLLYLCYTHCVEFIDIAQATTDYNSVRICNVDHH